MPDFNHLTKLDVSDESRATFTFYQIEGEPKLEVTTASQANKPYQLAVLKKSSQATRAAAQSARLNPRMLAQNRNEDRELYPLHIVKGWSGVKDSKGKEVAFSIDNVKAFLVALPDWLFDELRLFCTSPQSFIEGGEVDVEETAKN